MRILFFGGHTTPPALRKHPETAKKLEGQKKKRFFLLFQGSLLGADGPGPTGGARRPYFFFFWPDPPQTARGGSPYPV